MHINISTSPAFFRWRPAAWLRVGGADAAAFLQGQFTNDLRPLAQVGAAAVYGLWLTLKGKVLADSFVVRGVADEYWVGSYDSPAAVIRERLESYVIADDVVIEDRTAEWAGISVLGPGAMTPEGEGAWVFPGRRDRGENHEWMYPVSAGEPAWVRDHQGPWLTAEEVTRRRIGAGIPAIPADVGPGDLPNEAGLEAEAISYTKGCYLGQEVMARLKSMGQVRRRLVRVGGAGESIPALPVPLFGGGRAVGELRSAVRDGAGGWSGLAMLSRLQVAAGAELAWTPQGNPAVRVLEAP
jgi:folate-binding protein YgfZ